MRRLPGILILWAALGACGDDTVIPPPVSDPTVDSILVAPADHTVGVLGTTFPVGASALAEDGSTVYGSTMEPGRFTWSSSAPDVARLSTALHAPTGNELPVVTAVGEGTATITATSDGLTGSTTVTVEDRAGASWSTPLDWAVAEPGVPIGDVAIGADGTIYVGADRGELNRSRWFALSPEGTPLWSVDLPFTWFSTAAVGADGTLYIGSNPDGSTGGLIAVDPGGTVRWMRQELDDIISGPAIGADGTIYVAGGSSVYAVDPQGEILWVYEAEDAGFNYSSPAVGSDGTVYVGGGDSRLYAIDSNGSLRWTFGTGGNIQSSPSIGRDGTIYVGANDGELYAIHPDGTERWSVRVNCGGPWGCQAIQASPSIGADGTIYIGGDEVVAVDPGGTVRWTYRLPRSGNVLSTPAVGADGTVYVTSGQSVYALDAQGRLLWDFRTGGSIFGSPAIGVDGAIIAASFPDSAADSWNGTVHAVVETASSNGGYAASPWPTKRGGRSNNGRAGG